MITESFRLNSFSQFSFNAYSENWILHNTILRFIFFIDFNHSCIETVKINESRNNECTYLRFDSPNRKLGPESNNRLGCKMAKFSDMLPGKR